MLHLLSRASQDTILLYKKFEDNLSRANLEWTYISGINEGRPYYVIQDKQYRIYLRPVTLDKGSKDVTTNRRRFQIPGSWFPFRNAIDNAVLGYVADSNVYLCRYIASYNFDTRQVNRSTYEDKERLAIDVAQRYGIATYEMRSGETLVAVRGDFLSAYLPLMDTWHKTKVALGNSEPVRSDHGAIRTDLESPTKKRNPVFRRLTMEAYKNACAVCGLQGATVEAAHAFAVMHGGNNTVNNGIALCANHHILFDDGLLAIFPDYSLRINYEKLKHYSRSKMAFGLIDCLNSSRRLRLPKNKKDWPDPSFLLKTLKFHGWSITQKMVNKYDGS